MLKRAALAVLFLATLAIGAAYASAFLPGGAPPAAVWAVALACPATLVAVMVLGAERGGSIGRLAGPFALAFLLLAGGFAAVLLLPPADPAEPALWLGLPPRAAILLYGVGLLPFLVIPVAYAATFESRTLSDADLERVREAARELRRGRAADGRPPRTPAETAAGGAR